MRLGQRLLLLALGAALGASRPPAHYKAKPALTCTEWAEPYNHRCVEARGCWAMCRNNATVSEPRNDNDTGANGDGATRPRVVAIVATCNRTNSLADAVESVLAQVGGGRLPACGGHLLRCICATLARRRPLAWQLTEAHHVYPTTKSSTLVHPHLTPPPHPTTTTTA